ncbi:MAG: hypothetical protein CMJ17_09670 [Phenylobacterium sp.]|nr:hypothetical protein [Phenylobacterium sp.]
MFENMIIFLQVRPIKKRLLEEVAVRTQVRLDPFVFITMNHRLIQSLVWHIKRVILIFAQIV